MKTWFSLFFISLTLSYSLLIGSCGEEGTQSKEQKNSASAAEGGCPLDGCDDAHSGKTHSEDEKIIYFTVQGITCHKCKAKIEAELIAIDGIKSVLVLLNQTDKNVKVEFLPKKISPQQIQEAINKTGKKVIASH